MSIEPLYTKGEASKILRCAPTTLSHWISQRRIAAVKGRPVLIPESAIKEFIRKRTQRALV
ncbi:MAG: helix-turn-helix domain-containing protein [Deltaproteobacteria bacterium]|nr:helix-turn-helix domain-containing protein [Deltaproteobacteria bacterium]